MKRIFIPLIYISALFSCSKTVEQDKVTTLKPIASNSAFTELVWNNHTVKGEWNDTTAFVRQEGITEFAGDSWFENAVYERFWKTVYVPLKVINRGIGGTTFTTSYPYLDSSAKYAPYLKTLNIHLGTNEYLQFPLSSNKNVLAVIRPSAIKFFKRARTLFPYAQINLHEVEASPKLIALGYKDDIILANLFYDSLVLVDVRAGNKSIVVRTNALMGTNDISLYRADSIHPNNTGYEKMRPLIVASVVNSTGSVKPADTIPPTPVPPVTPPVDTIVVVPPTPPTTPPNKRPVAKAGADKTVRDALKQFFVLNAGGSYDTDGTITRFVWSQVSGPTNAKLLTWNAVTTKISNWKTGKYVFKVTVYDNQGASSNDTVIITVKK